MSPNDMYLSLCLEQASMSPLHYRHGSIIVRGGKVIGQGFNDYRSGYNGGVLSTGQLRSVTAVHGPAVRALKKKAKVSTGHTQLQDSKGIAKSTKPYSAFANQVVGTGGGCLANTPLSMHSEMMAINSALSLSSTIACQGSARSTQWLQKPCFKLPCRSKRQARLQRLKAYADAVCEEVTKGFAASERRGMSQVQQSRFEPCSDLLQGTLQGGQSQQGAAARGGGGAAEGAGASGKEEPRQFRGVPKSRGVAETGAVLQRETPEAVFVRHTTHQSHSSPPPPLSPSQSPE